MRADNLQVMTWLNLQRIDAANAGAGKGGTTSKVKLRGLPYGATTMDVVNFFKGFGVTESNVQFGVNSVSLPPLGSLARVYLGVVSTPLSEDRMLFARTFKKNERSALVCPGQGNSADPSNFRIHIR